MEAPKDPYQQKFMPTFLPGYHYPNKYHNIGQLRTPYIGKKFGTVGDYAPPQRKPYYTPYNRNYPYVMDSDFHAVGYLPTERSCYRCNKGYFPCRESKYPEEFIPPDYFSPHTRYPEGHAPRVSGEIENYKRLAVGYPSLKNARNFPPFNKYY